jgi:protein-L-isoaspartate(D-aspartate) O-methyltransferase
MTMNLELARDNMVENQIRTWEVLDPRVLGVLGRLRREDFVPERYRDMAFVDVELPLGHGEVMMKPVIEGRILQALAIESGQRVLEIGTGSGFLSACLAELGADVTSVEQHADLAHREMAADLRMQCRTQCRRQRWRAVDLARLHRDRFQLALGIGRGDTAAQAGGDRC